MSAQDEPGAVDHVAPSTETQLALLVQEARSVREELGEIRTMLEGPPYERSVRGRLHSLEAESSAAKLASEMVAEARRERRQLQVEHKRASDARGRVRWKMIGAATAAALAIYPYVAHFSHWH